MSSFKPGDFIELAKNYWAGSLMMILSYLGNAATENLRWAGGYKIAPLSGCLKHLPWQAHSYDFRHALDRLHPEWIGDFEYWCLLNKGLQNIRSGAFNSVQSHFPCAYVLRCVADAYDYHRSYVLLFEMANGVLVVHQFMRQRARREPNFGKWTYDGVVGQISPGERPCGAARRSSIASTQLAVEVDEYQANRAIEDAIVATELLVSARACIVLAQQIDSRVERFNKSQRGLSIQHPTVVAVDKSKLSAMAASWL